MTRLAYCKLKVFVKPSGQCGYDFFAYWDSTDKGEILITRWQLQTVQTLNTTLKQRFHTQNLHPHQPLLSRCRVQPTLLNRPVTRRCLAWCPSRGHQSTLPVLVSGEPISINLSATSCEFHTTWTPNNVPVIIQQNTGTFGSSHQLLGDRAFE